MKINYRLRKLVVEIYIKKETQKENLKKYVKNYNLNHIIYYRLMLIYQDINYKIKF